MYMYIHMSIESLPWLPGLGGCVIVGVGSGGWRSGEWGRERERGVGSDWSQRVCESRRSEWVSGEGDVEAGSGWTEGSGERRFSAARSEGQTSPESQSVEELIAHSQLTEMFIHSH